MKQDPIQKLICFLVVVLCFWLPLFMDVARSEFQIRWVWGNVRDNWFLLMESMWRHLIPWQLHSSEIERPVPLEQWPVPLGMIQSLRIWFIGLFLLGFYYCHLSFEKISWLGLSREISIVNASVFLMFGKYPPFSPQMTFSWLYQHGTIKMGI